MLTVALGCPAGAEKLTSGAVQRGWNGVGRKLSRGREELDFGGNGIHRSYLPFLILTCPLRLISAK